MKYICLQLSKCDCGFACLKMLLSHYHKQNSYLYLETDLTKHENLSFYDLKSLAAKNGLFLNGYTIYDLSLIKKFPIIGLLKIQNTFHYVIIYKIKRNLIYVIDPKVGKCIYTIDEFKDISTNKYLIVEDCHKTTIKKSLKLGFNYFLFFICNFIQIISIFLISFETGKLSINLIIFGSIFLISYSFNKVYLQKSLKSFDKRVIYQLLNDVDNKMIDVKNEEIENLYYLKKEYFTYFQKIFTYSTTFGFLIFVLCINNLWHIIFILLSLLFCVFYNQNQTYKLNLNSEIKFHKNYYLKYLYLDKNAYKISNKALFFNVFKFILIILFNVMICLINNKFEPFIYYIILYNFLTNEFLNILKLSQERLILDKYYNLYKTLEIKIKKNKHKK